MDKPYPASQVSIFKKEKEKRITLLREMDKLNHIFQVSIFKSKKITHLREMYKPNPTSQISMLKENH